jgi:hypothetical protein
MAATYGGLSWFGLRFIADAQNATGDFWTDLLMIPLLIATGVVTGIFLLIVMVIRAAGRLSNKPAELSPEEIARRQEINQRRDQGGDDDYQAWQG